MSTNRTGANILATLLMVVAVLLIMNLIVAPETTNTTTVIFALITLAGAVGLWGLMWLENRPRTVTEVETTDVIAIPQMREWVVEKPAPRIDRTTNVMATTPAASVDNVAVSPVGTATTPETATATTTNDAGETATVVGPRDEPAAAGVVSPQSEAMIEEHGKKGDVEPLVGDPLHPDLTPKTIRHQEEVEKQAAEFEAEQEQVREHPGGENFQPQNSTEQQNHPPELATNTDAKQEGQTVEIPPKPAEPDLDREHVADDAAAAPMGESQLIQDARNGDPVAEKRVAEATAAHETEPISQEQADAIAEQVTPEKAVNYAEVEHTEVKGTNAYVDSLEDIEGIGPVFRDILVKAGITTFEQLSKMSHEEITDILQKAEVKRIPRSSETWAEQAAYLARDDRQGLSRFQATLTGGRRTGGDD